MRTPVLIAGGGLAGLVCSLELARRGIEVVVFEKKGYPAHKVCGEYVSNEVKPYLTRIGFPRGLIEAIPVSRLQVSSPKGNLLSTPLKLGGFGISRYLLDDTLHKMALEAGVTFHYNSPVVSLENTGTVIRLTTGSGRQYEAGIVVGAYGKQSRLDKLRAYALQGLRSPYMAVKYHIDYDFPTDTISLHNFADGYCGISAIENGRYCLCYMTNRNNLKRYGRIPDMESQLLGRNPHLRKIFSEARFLYTHPLVINEISFQRKTSVENGIFMAGDTAGLIPPLCGNGMAMAIHSGKLLAEILITLHKGHITRQDAEKAYSRAWQQLFGRRLWVGRQVQSIFGKELLTEAAISVLKRFPAFTEFIVRQTHGSDIDRTSVIEA